MAIINSYSNDTTVNGTDKLIGSDGAIGATNGNTLNYTVTSLSAWVGQYGLGGTVNLGNTTFGGAVKVALNEIVGTAGDVFDINIENHFNVISFQNGNGTMTINLPSAVEGVMLRFKTDSTISNSNDVLLQPQSGQTIDGASNYIMDRAYDGITLLGYQSNWFIIQKKDK